MATPILQGLEYQSSNISSDDKRLHPLMVNLLVERETSGSLMAVLVQDHQA